MSARVRCARWTALCALLALPAVALGQGGDDARPSGGDPSDAEFARLREPAERPPEVAVLAERGALPRSCSIDPKLDFSTTQFRDFQVDGIQVSGAVIVGQINASSVDRETLTASLGARCSLWERLEGSVNVPWVRRADRADDRVVAEGSPSSALRRSRGGGLGDVELGLHYQFAHRSADAPFLLGSLQIKSNTGHSPFELARDQNGLETELATGSGYWSVEPSLTWIYPSDPAVIYGSLSYNWSPRTHIGESFVRTVRRNDASPPEQVRTEIEEIDPGDSIGVSFGMGLALNERLALNLGYSHRYVMRTRTAIDGRDFWLDPLHQGSLLLGLSYAATPARSYQVSLAIGVTKGAPDLRLSVRAPLSWSWGGDR